jgi:hypothetical protein
MTPVEDDDEEVTPVVEPPPFDRTVITDGRLGDELDEEWAYWQTQTPQQRLHHIEVLRQLNYGHRARTRLPRLLEVVKKPWG